MDPYWRDPLQAGPSGRHPAASCLLNPHRRQGSLLSTSPAGLLRFLRCLPKRTGINSERNPGTTFLCVLFRFCRHFLSGAFSPSMQISNHMTLEYHEAFYEQAFRSFYEKHPLVRILHASNKFHLQSNTALIWFCSVDAGFRRIIGSPKSAHQGRSPRVHVIQLPSRSI